MARESLRKYFGKNVTIKGKYVGRPKKHEETGIEFIESIGKWNLDERMNTLHSPSEEKPNGITSPIRFPKFASCLVDITGVGKFSSIRENHVNIQEDIALLHSDICIDDYVELQGVVVGYIRANGSLDYGIGLRKVKKL